MFSVSVTFLLTLHFFLAIISIIFGGNITTIISQIEIYKWVVFGIIVFFFLRKTIRKNIVFFETFSHELSHTILAFFFGRKILSFHAESKGSGEIYTSGKHSIVQIPISLAPYCLPIFTYFLLSMRWLMDFHGVWIFDIIIGMTICFHFYCFKTQLSSAQPDINQYPLSFSYFYIITSWLMNVSIIMMSFFPNMNGRGTLKPIYNYGVFSAVVRMFESWWDTLTSFFTWIISFIL